MKPSSIIEFIRPEDHCKFCAKIYFMELYGEDNIIYHKDEDYYTYKNHDFGYFLSGVNLGIRDLLNCSFLLTSREIPFTWLFTYGNQEDRWNDFIKRHNEDKKIYEPKEFENKNIIKKIIKRWCGK